MRISPEKLAAEAQATGFRPDVLEKAARLLGLLDRGMVDSTILTADASLQRRIQNQPLLEWKALNVRRHKGQ